MAMGKRKSQQAPIWIPTTELPVSPGHPFYVRLNAILDEAGFDRFAEEQCQAFYAPVMGRPGLRGSRARRRSGRRTEDRLEDPVGLPDVFGPPPAGDEREDLFGLLARHRGPHIRQLTQRDLERDRHPVQAVDGDRLLSALDLADELARQARAITQPPLTESALLAQGPHPLPQEFPHVLHRAFAHGLVYLSRTGTRRDG